MEWFLTSLLLVVRADIASRVADELRYSARPKLT